MGTKSEYAQGKNPNSLKNLKRGGFSRAKCSEAGKKSGLVRKAKRTMKEIAEELAIEEMVVNKGNKETIMTKLEIILSNFYKECAQNPTYKNILALRQLLGEDVQQVEVTATDGKYSDVEVTDEDRARAVAIFEGMKKRKQ